MKTLKLLIGIKIILTLLFAIGYVKCVIKLVNCDFDGSKSSYKAEIVYSIGCLTGLGGIVGWLNVGY